MENHWHAQQIHRPTDDPHRKRQNGHALGHPPRFHCRGHLQIASLCRRFYFGLPRLRHHHHRFKSPNPISIHRRYAVLSERCPHQTPRIPENLNRRIQRHHLCRFAHFCERKNQPQRIGTKNLRQEHFNLQSQSRSW